jgi:D-3-phosphoglycerate dehydrogenase
MNHQAEEIMRRFKTALVGLDGQTVPDWVPARLAEEQIDLVVRECITDEDLVHYAADADVVWLFGGSRVVTAQNISLLKRCGAILRTGSGTDNVPVEAATQHGILVANTPDATVDAVSDHALGLLFAALRQIAVQDRAIRGGTWDRTVAWPRWSLRGRTLGLVGFGRIGQLLVRKLSGFEMTTLACDPQVSAEVMAKHGVRAAGLDELLSRSDVVSLHCPLTSATRHLIDERALRKMKPTAVLINTSRGPVIEERALVRALTEGWIMAAGLDVFEQEPLGPDHPLLRLNNVVLTPHIAGYSDEYLEASWRLSVETVVALSQGRRPRAYVNRPESPRWTLS